MNDRDPNPREFIEELRKFAAPPTLLERLTRFLRKARNWLHRWRAPPSSHGLKRGDAIEIGGSIYTVDRVKDGQTVVLSNGNIVTF